MTPDSPDAYDRLPESLTGAKTLFDLHGEELLELAAILRLTQEERSEPSEEKPSEPHREPTSPLAEQSPPLAEQSRPLADEKPPLADEKSSRIANTVTAMAEFHEAELTANLGTRAALLDGEIAFVEEDVQRRAALLPQLEANYTLRTSLRDARDAAAADITRLGLELLTRRHAAEEERLQTELESIQDEQDSARRSDTGDESGSPTARQQQISELQQRRDQIVTAETSTFAREDELRSRWITRTISGFLLWLGYASVVATGSVLALVMSSADAFELRPLVDGTRTLVVSVFPGLPPWIRLFIVLGLVIGLLWVIARVFIAADKLLRKQWQWDEKLRGDATAQMSPQALTPGTYARFVALLPFAFTVTILVVILALAPGPASNTTPHGNAFLSSIFPTVGYSFIGIAIAFLSTAVFVMYFIQLVRPRADGTPVLRNAWEFAIPPLLLITAIALTPLHADVPAGRWMPWAAFMLLSSIALACGLVFHGIFKDAKRARDRIIRIDRRLQRLTGIPADEDEESKDYAPTLVTDRDRVRRALRRLRLRSFGVSSTSGEPRSENATDTTLVPMGELVRTYHAIDLVVAPDLVRELESRRAAHARITDDLHDLSRSISELEFVLSFAAMNHLVRRQHLLHAIKTALTSHQEERRQHAWIAKELLHLKIGVTESATGAIGPLFRAARDVANDGVMK